MSEITTIENEEIECSQKVASVEKELKWEVALKFLTDFVKSENKVTVTNIINPKGGDVYIFFSPDKDDIKDLSTVDKWQWYNNRNKTPFPTGGKPVEILKTYFDARDYNALSMFYQIVV